MRADAKTTPAEKISEINQEFKERDIRAKAKQLGLKYIDLRSAPLNQDAIQLMSWEEVQRSQSITFDLKGKLLSVACVDPESESCHQIIDQLQKKGYEVESFLCSAEGIASTEHFFEHFIKQEEVPIKTTIAEEAGLPSPQAISEEEKKIFEQGTGPEMVNTMNLKAVSFRASDIHFQPQENEIIVRMRRDGQLYEILKLSPKQHLLLAGEIKRSAGLKVNITNIPQDGDYQFVANERKISVRVSSLPSKHGESIVLRILDAQNAITELDQLGFSEENKEKIITRLQKDRGLILVTGPTGSGKTSTLYSCLHYMNQPDKKIITLEDPIEFELENIIQSEINEAEDYSFASGLRAVLRQDPDVIMVGEIRDREAAEIALQASLTGHVVLSTLHANDALGGIPRLLNMKVKAYILAAGLEMIIGQRLVRTICQNCKVPAELSDEVKKELEKIIKSLQKKGKEVNAEQIFTAKGCEQCANTAYQGRTALSEVLPISDRIRKAILTGEGTDVILEEAEKEGFISIKEDGILKVLEGKTTLEEVWKVLV